MHIAVTIGPGFADQSRAYAEYRLFSVLAPFTESVRDARLSLSGGAVGGLATCAVSVTRADGGRVRIRVRGCHAYDAINRAVDRVGRALRRDMRAALTS